MKKFLLVSLVFCAMFASKISAQNDWITMNFQLLNQDEYTFSAVKFYPNSVTALYDTGESLLIGGKKDGSAGVFYRSTSGWNSEVTYPGRPANSISYTVSEGGVAWNETHYFKPLKGIINTQSIVYVYGVEGTLMKKQNMSSAWYPLSIRGTEDVDFTGGAFTPDGNIGVITDGTRVYFTADQGISWIDAQLPAGLNSRKINEIIFHSIDGNVNTFFAVGEDGLLLKSITSGYSWSIIPVVDLDDPVDFTSITFIDENTAYIAGVGIGGDKMRAGIWTGTGMNTPNVEVFRIPASASFTSGAIRDFMGAEEEFYAMTEKGEIITTKDGGVTWGTLRAIEETNPVVSYFISPTRVLYVLRENGAMEALVPELAATIVPEQSAILNKYRFYARDLQGYISNIRWEYENAYPSFTNNLLATPLIQFNRNGEQEVKFIISGKIPGGEAQEKTITIKVDPETNFSWEHVLVSPADLNPARPHYGVINTGVHFPGGQNQIGYMSTQLFTTGDEGFVWKTEDGGETWNCILKSDRSKGINVEGLHSVCFPTMDVGFACGWRNIDETQTGAARWGDFQLWRTEDAGETWELLDVASELIYADGFGISNDQYFSNIVFLDENRGIVHSSMAVLYTEDRGKTWKGANFNLRRPTEMPPSAIFEVCHAEGDILYGSGNQGEFYRSTDAGKTWEYVTSSGGTVQSVDFYDKDLGIKGLIAGNGPCVSITRDGGQSWERVAIEGISEIFIQAVKFASRDVVYAAGASIEGTVLHKSVDGGRTWKLESFPTVGESVYDLFITQTGVVHAACTDGVQKHYIPDMEAGFDYTVDKRTVLFANKSVGYITDYEWKINGEVKSSEASLSFDFATNGQYTVELTVSGTDPRNNTLVTKTVSQIIDLTHSSIDLIQVTGLSVYPNPVVDYLHFTFNTQKESDVKVVVTNLLGQTVSTTEYTNLSSGVHHYSIDANNWSGGVYVVTFVIDGKPTKSIKVTK